MTAARWLRRRLMSGPRGPMGDAGSAVVEFVTVGVLMLIPTVYLIVTLSRIQAGIFATEGAARAAGRAITAADTEAEGRALAGMVVGYALADQGFDDDPFSVTTVTCSATPCLTPQASVTVTVEVSVDLPGVPGFAADVIPTSIPVSATHTAVVDRFRGRP